MAIFDGFTFFNELDVLEMRLIELDPVVDYFVLVEGDTTFRGDPKPMVFAENRELFNKYRSKILYCPVELPKWPSRDGEGPWIREKYQRNAIGEVFKMMCQPEDLVMVSDVDEIPRRETIATARPKVITSLNMEMFYYGLNVHAGVWGAAKILPFGCFTTAQEAREAEANRFYNDGGWHFSYLGDEHSISQKIKSFSHWELDHPEVTNVNNIKSRMDKLEDVWGHSNQYERVPVDNTFPHAVRENPRYYAKYIR